MKSIHILVSTILFLLLPCMLPAQQITHLTGFDITESSQKDIYNIVKLDSNTSLVLFTKPKMLWRSNGSKNGTYLLRNWESEASFQNGVFCNILGVINGKAIMLVSTNEFGKELWVTDGTVNGTHLLVDFYPGAAGLVATANRISKSVEIDNTLYFLIREGKDVHLMRTNGEVSGTEIYVKNIAKLSTSFVEDMPQLFYSGNYFYFIHNDDLYKVDNVSKAIEKVSFYNGEDIADLVALDNNSVLIATRESFGSGVYSFNFLTNQFLELITSDHFFDYGDNFIDYGFLKKYNNSHYIVVRFDNFYSLYKTDGTLVGTKLISNLEEGVERFIEYENKLYFGNHVGGFYGIYSLDNLDKLTFLINSGNLSGEGSRGFGLMSNNKFFSSNGYVQTGLDDEPHTFDPGSKTVTKLANLNQFFGSYPQLFTEVNSNKYFFYAEDDAFEGSLYLLKLNSTPTSEVLDLVNIKAINNITNDKWNILFEDYKSNLNYNLFNTEGKLVKTENISSNEFAIDAKDLPNGIYFLNVGTASLKLIKQ